jgi:predicted metalloprotease
MKYDEGQREYIEDRRGGGMIRRGAPLGLGGLLLLLVLSWATGTDFLSLVGDQGAAPSSSPVAPAQPAGPASAEERKLEDMAGAVMKDLNEVWSRLLPSRYRPTKLVLFRDQVQADGCGFAESATGPFYCPGGERVFVDLGFYDELDRRFGAAGDFAQAYVLAHEVGHHVQAVLGIEEKVREAQQARPGQANALSVRMELQADCFAGVWGHVASQPGRYQRERKVELEPGDAEEGLNAAAAIGDDRMQRMAGSRVSPERFTHGSSQQRVEWFRRGLQSGNPDSCDTFGTR